MKLPVKSEQVILVWYQDLEDLLKKQFGKTTNMAALWEASQNTIWDVEINSDPRYLEYWDQGLSDKEYVQKAEGQLHDWMEYGDSIDPAIPLWDLCRKGLFPECSIKVHVWW